MKELYYGVWSQMCPWSVAQRAALVAGIILLIVYLLFLPLLLCGFSWIVRGLDMFVRGIYLIVGQIAEKVMEGRTLAEKASVLNLISMRMRRISDRFCDWAGKLADGKRPKFWKIAILYVCFMLAVTAPDWLNHKVHDRYMPAIAMVRNIYEKAEAPALKKAVLYPPLFVKAVPKKPAETEETQETQEIEEVWLMLSEDGRAGANIRTQATRNSSSVEIVSGDVRLLYLDEQQDGWLHVRLENGAEGWIRDYLVEEVGSK